MSLWNCKKPSQNEAKKHLHDHLVEQESAISTIIMLVNAKVYYIRPNCLSLTLNRQKEARLWMPVAFPQIFSRLWHIRQNK